MTKKLGINFHMVANDVYESYDKGQKPKNKDLKELYELSKEYVKEYEETKPKKLSIGMVKKFTDNFDSYDSDVWILEMLSGDIDLDKMKATMLDHKNYPNVLDIYKKEKKQ